MAKKVLGFLFFKVFIFRKLFVVFKEHDQAYCWVSKQKLQELRDKYFFFFNTSKSLYNSTKHEEQVY